jgi:hypothetical protein
VSGWKTNGMYLHTVAKPEGEILAAKAEIQMTGWAFIGPVKHFFRESVWQLI